MVSLVVVDDHPVIRVSLVELLSDVEGYSVVASGGSAADAVRLVAEHPVSLLLIDIQVPGHVFETIWRLRLCNPDLRIVVFTASDRIDHVIAAMKAGANGYVLKRSTVGELTCALARVVAGETFITPSFAGKVIKSVRAQAAERAATRSRPSECEDWIIRLALMGCTNDQIARQLRISDKTVEAYTAHMMRTLMLRRRAEATPAEIELRRSGPKPYH